MTLPIYPRLTPLNTGTSTPSSTYLVGLGFTQKWTPVFFNQSQKAINGASVDISLAFFPLHNFELTYEVLRNTPGQSVPLIDYEFRRLIGFYTAMQGSAGRFYFDFEDDNQVLATPIGTGDGTTTTFVVTRTFFDFGQNLAQGEPVGTVASVGGRPVVYLNGTPTAAYTLNTTVPANNTITFSSAPGAGVAITADLYYFYYCKFVEDSLQFEKFSSGRWSAASVKIQSCRPGA